MDMVPMPNVTLQEPAIGSIGYWRRPRQRVVANDVVIWTANLNLFVQVPALRKLSHDQQKSTTLLLTPSPMQLKLALVQSSAEE